jgi:cyclophilin family peptidyl-prolyl cis-trans isomerase
MANHNRFNEEKLHQMQFALLTEVIGRWKADIIEDYLKSEEIDVVLIQDAIFHVTHITAFAPVKIYVPKASIPRARNLLKTFDEAQDEPKEEANMANKKKIEIREKQLAAQRTERNIRIIGLGLVILLVVAGFWFFAPKGQAQSQQNAQTNLGNGSTVGACAPFADIAAASQYGEPPTNIDTSKLYFATVKMAKGGEFVIQLYPDKAPKTVNSFVFLACKGYFNGVTFHRVLEGFMAQGGDPTGTGSGGPGYEFEYEGNDLKFDKAGVVAMANTGAGTPTNGSQFFITFGPTPQLDGGYTIFGQVTQGMDVVNAITRRDPQQNPTFEGDAMESVTITEQ